MRTIAALLAAGALAFMLTGCGGAQAPKAPAAPDGADVRHSGAEPAELVVSAAASMSDSLRELQKRFEAGHPGIKLRFNFGASGALQQQIEQGAPADLFVSAAAKNMQALVARGLVESKLQTTLLYNELVLVVPKTGNAPNLKLADLAKADVKRIALGEPESVPAGSYAKEALTNAKLWDSLQPKLLFAKDVRQVLTYVESGNADAGFVYKTDALTSKQAAVAEPVDAKLYKPIEIQVGIVKATKHGEEAQALYDYLQTKEAADLFSGFGFTPAKR
ncbi:molybdate ABC transporter substrate-binding protein [Gordoniibacillus kamchatkensis]|nr:molybdate ABC transporter substrate-binding protein [Paenibacillus sp. VKM B-2647]